MPQSRDIKGLIFLQIFGADSLGARGIGEEIELAFIEKFILYLAGSPILENLQRFVKINLDNAFLLEKYHIITT